jgi:hypothetical protein
MENEQPTESRLVLGATFVVGCCVLVEDLLDPLHHPFSARPVEMKDES